MWFCTQSTEGGGNIYGILLKFGWRRQIQYRAGMALRLVGDMLSAYSARTAHPFQRNGAPFRFKLSKAQQVD